MSTARELDSQPHEALVRAVAARTMRWPFRMWAFGESVALRGLLAASRATACDLPSLEGAAARGTAIRLEPGVALTTRFEATVFTERADVKSVLPDGQIR